MPKQRLQLVNWYWDCFQTNLHSSTIGFAKWLRLYNLLGLRQLASQAFTNATLSHKCLREARDEFPFVKNPSCQKRKRCSICAWTVWNYRKLYPEDSRGLQILCCYIRENLANVRGVQIKTSPSHNSLPWVHQRPKKKPNILARIKFEGFPKYSVQIVWKCAKLVWV